MLKTLVVTVDDEETVVVEEVVEVKLIVDVVVVVTEVDVKLVTVVCKAFIAEPTGVTNTAESRIAVVKETKSTLKIRRFGARLLFLSFNSNAASLIIPDIPYSSTMECE